MEEEYFTPVEVAQKLKVTRAAIYKWMAEGKLEYVFVGSDRRITRAAIEAFIKVSTAARKGEDPGKIEEHIEALMSAAA